MIAGREELRRNWELVINEDIHKILDEYENFQIDRDKCWEISYESEKCLKLFSHYENVFQHLFKDLVIDFSGFEWKSEDEFEIDFAEMIEFIQFMRGNNHGDHDGFFMMMYFFKVANPDQMRQYYSILRIMYS